MAYANDWTKQAGGYNVGTQILDQIITLQRYIDCSVTALTSTEFTKLWAVPAGFAVLSAYVICHTGETTSSTDDVDIVDDDSATTVFVNDANMTATEVGATNARKQYAAAGFICVRPNHDLATCAFSVVIKGIVKSTTA